MPFNILNKKAWLSELDNLTNVYISFLNKAEDSKEGIPLDLEISKKYKVNEMLFIGQEIVDNIQKSLTSDNDFIYEFRIVDNKPLVRKRHRVYFDNNDNLKTEEVNAIVTIEDLKSKYVESLMKIQDLKNIIEKKDSDNFKLFVELVEASGGLYQYVSKRKLVLTLSKILKEKNFYDNEIGTQYSYDKLSAEDKQTIVNILYTKVYK